MTRAKVKLPTESYPNAYRVGEEILVQLTGQYHTPFALSIEDAKKLVDDMCRQITKYNVSKESNPWCECASQKDFHEDGGLGACKGDGCNCKKFSLDYDEYRPC